MKTGNLMAVFILAVALAMGLAGASLAAPADTGTVTVVIPSYRHLLVGNASMTYLATDFAGTPYGTIAVTKQATATVAWVHNYLTNQKITVQAGAWIPSVGADKNIKLEVEYIAGASPLGDGLLLIDQDGTPSAAAQDIRTGMARGHALSDGLRYTATVLNDGLVCEASYVTTVTYTILNDTTIP